MNENNYPDKIDHIEDGDEMITQEELRRLKKRMLIRNILAIIVITGVINFLLLRVNVEVYQNKLNVGFKSIFQKDKADESAGTVTEEDEISEKEIAYSKFEEKMRSIYQGIYNVYDGEIDDQKLFNEAYKGMVSALGDPYSRYLDEEDLKATFEDMEGSYVGIGIYVGVNEKGIVVVSPFKDSPADKAGLEPGDIIKVINGIEIGQNLEKGISIMKGKKGGLVTLTIEREGVEPFEVEIIRDEIKKNTVFSEELEDGIGYIGISMFGNETGNEFKKEYLELKDKGMEKLVVDLRGNPGGLVSTVLDVTSNFIPKGEVVTYTIDKYDSKYEYKSHGGIAQDIPVVVLIDGGSASASEIFTGAIRDYERGTIVGEKSFGKGIVQSFLTEKYQGFGDGTALKLTISSYYTPKGENIHKKGIMPQIEVKFDSENFNRDDKKTDNQLQKAIETLKAE